MEKKHIITISGKPGSGKSSTADKVAELLGYSRYSSGDMVRNLLSREGLTLAEYNRQATDNHSLDDKIDQMLRGLRNKNDIVIDSRLGFYWLPESFKVYLDQGWRNSRFSRHSSQASAVSNAKRTATFQRHVWR